MAELICHHRQQSESSPGYPEVRQINQMYNFRYPLLPYLSVNVIKRMMKFDLTEGEGLDIHVGRR